MIRHVLALSASAAILSIALVGAQTAPARPVVLSVDEIVANNLKAKGGLDRWTAVQSIKQTATVTSQGTEAEMTIYGKRPNMTRQEILVQGQLIVNAFDGKTAWILNPAMAPGPVPVTGQQAAMILDQSDFDGTLVNYKSKGTVIDLVGTETMGGDQGLRPTGASSVLHLKVAKKNGTVEHYYLDATTFLEVKLVSESYMGGASIKLETQFGNYKEADGITWPFLVRTLSNGTPTTEIVVSKVEFNVKLDDAFFRIPAK